MEAINFSLKNVDKTKAWLQKTNSEEFKFEFTKSLIERRDRKGISKALCQVELRSLGFPSLLSFDKFAGINNYNSLCNEISLKERFNYSIPNFFNTHSEKDFKVIIDTREQKPISFNISEFKKLDYGDYLLFNENQKVFFERKSLPDLISTMTSGLERFKREIQRASKNNDNLIILIEEPLSLALDFKKKESVYQKTRITPAFLFRNIRDLIQENDNIQFVFCRGRDSMKPIMERIFSHYSFLKNADLQFLIDLKIL